jgi:hypothetical protein
LQDAGEVAFQEATKILAGSRAAYAACRTYEDTGTHDSLDRADPHDREIIDFHTVFAGPHALRFAYRWRSSRQQGDLTQLFADATGFRSIIMDYGHTRPDQDDSLGGALGAQRGTSRGLTTAIIPLLTFADGMESDLDLVQDARWMGEEDVGGTACDAIEGSEHLGTRPVATHIKVWIARSDALIRQVTRDLVETEAYRAWSETMMAHAWASREATMRAFLRDAGRSDAEIESTVEDWRMPRFPLRSPFTTITYHPRCNQPISPEALRATDGGL